MSLAARERYCRHGTTASSLEPRQLKGDNHVANSEGKTPSKQIQDFGAAPGVGVIDFPSLPAGVETSVIPIRASDGVASRGVLYTRGGEKTVVCFSHPRGDMSQHYAVPALLEAGYAAYGHQCRGLNNDVDCEHEKIILDLAAGFTHLKEVRGFEKLVLLGNSGGGSLVSFYQQQAATAPPGRLTDTAAGEPCDLNAVNMPRADGMMFLAVHPGEGKFMLDCIDPSIVDEDDPLSVDPALDMYNPANGFREPPEPSQYSAEFIERYRAAQRDRTARLDARARNWIDDQSRYRKMTQQPGFKDLPFEERIYIQRRADVGHYMIIYRTEANLAYTDLSIHSWRSTREVGSIISGRPDKLNYTPGGFARYMTPRGWLSSWSGLSTRAEILKTIAAIHEPLLMIVFTADNGCFPDGNQEQVDACPSKDKTMEFVDADHFARPHPERVKAMGMVAKWLKERFPAAEEWVAQ